MQGIPQAALSKVPTRDAKFHYHATGMPVF